MKRIIVLAIISMVLACKSPTKEKPDTFNQLTEFVDYYTKGILDQGNINTMSVAIYKDGKGYHNYYGDFESSIGNVPKDSLLFEVASITKIITGSLLAKAVVDKKLSLETDIRTFLPKNYPNLQFEETPITIKHLATHTLGFETPKKLDSIYQKIFSGHYGLNPINYTIEDLFNELESVKLTHKPGTFYDYNNVGPDLIAYILTQVYNKSYPEILYPFLNEIGMKNTYLQEYKTYNNRIIKGFDETGKQATIDQNPLLGGSSGIITSIPDLAKFIQYQLESHKPFIKESTRTLFQDEEQDEHLGYLWDLGYAEEEGFYYLKSGTSNGVQSILLICPDSNYGQLLIMTNTSEDATSNWLSLYNKIEYDLIKYPRINLWTKLESQFLKDPKEASEQYLELKKDTIHYIAESGYLNRIGYDYLYRNKIDTAIDVFNLAITADPQNANLYDSLGEVYFKAKNYEKSKENFEKSIKLNPNNNNAKKHIDTINTEIAKD